MPDHSICIVVPCYREGNRLPVADYLSFYESYPAVSLYFVDDGSNDNTWQVLQDVRKGREDRINSLQLAHNQGKGEAVRQGLLAALDWKPFDAVAFFDADLATPLQEVFLLAETMKQGDYWMVFGSRLMRMGSLIKRNPMRHYFGRVFATAASLVIPLPIYDTQCGAKLLRADLIRAICQEPFMSRWLFDLEIFARVIKQFGQANAEQRLLEVPLRTWVEKGDSRLKITDLFRVPYELWRIRRRYF
ncbi:MAG: glycosyltransferase [Spirosomataceae bacterium]